MNFKQIIQDYFTFSRNERKGVLLLLVIIFMLALANQVVFYFETPATIDPHLLQMPQEENLLLADADNRLVQHGKLFRFNPNTIGREALDSLAIPESIKRNVLKYRDRGGVYYAEKDFRKMYGMTDSIYKQIAPLLIFANQKVQLTEVDLQPELFAFDPNTSSDKDFARLGLSERQIQTIRNYQGKGGNFRNKADFMKLYSLSDSQKEALSDYVTIEAVAEKMAEIVNDQIEINGSDSIELMTLPGIGDKLSKRIVKYRDLLGGFYSIAQLNEVYGLNEKVIQQCQGRIKVDPTKIRKVDLNFADGYELSRHPYIQTKIAQQIVKFRTRYGPILDPSILRDSMILSHEEFTRLQPYL